MVDYQFIEQSRQERDEMLAVLDRHSVAERALDVIGTMATMTEDCFQEQIPIGLRCEGQEACARYYEEALFIPFPEIQADWHSTTMAKDVIVLCVRLFATMQGPWMGIPSTGRNFSIPLVAVIHFRGDLMVGESLYYDAATMCDQLGLDRSEVISAAKHLST